MSGSGIRRRDRRGRGVRGPLTPPGAPVSRTRAERFDDLVRDEVRRLSQRWGRELAQVEFAVEEVPPVGPGGLVRPLGADRWGWRGEPFEAASPLDDDSDPVPLSQTRSSPAGGSLRIVVYRRPIEARGGQAGGAEERELIRLVRDLLVEEVANLLGLSPESVDPSYDSPDD